MDPDAAFQEFFEAVEAGDCDRVSHVIADLNGWLARGGFPPLTVGRRELGNVWHTAVAKAIFRLALAHVRVVAAHQAE